LLHYFKEGKTEGQVRNYFTATDNHSLKDYYANATGGSVRYATKRYKGIEFVISGNFTHRTFGAGLNAKDAVTGRPSKWERELFDLAEPDNQGPAGRIGELNARYRHRNSYITIGRISPGYHPLINKSDGRMQGFAFEGIYSHIAVDSATTIKVSVLTGVSPRSYYQWYSLTEAIGLLSSGYQPDGTAADYKGSINANAVAYIGIEKKAGPFTLNLWDTHIQGLSNTIWAEGNYKGKRFTAGIQYSYQLPDKGRQGLPYSAQYVQPGENGQVASIMAGYKTGGFNVSLAYTKAFSTGRYLFPKELGRDQFYTSVPRSRIEGLGNSGVVKAGLEYEHRKTGLSLGLDATAIDGPGAEDYRFNKYGLDDYCQINSRVNYNFKGQLEGLTIAVMYVWRENKNVHSPIDVYNISDYSQFNVVTNFNF